ncbi:Uncharacterised protein [Mycobacterium tuberculosis]|nr:Uncharacterised protein [Mycobacterium tuberculosis]
MKNSKLARSPGFRLPGVPPGGSLNSIVMAPHLIVGIGPCEKVIASLVMLSTLPSPTCLGAPAAGMAGAAVPGAAVPGAAFRRASTPLRLASESIRN